MELHLTRQHHRHLRRALEPPGRVPRKFIRYPSGRLEVELEGPEGVHRVDLTPERPRPRPTGTDWTPLGLFGGAAWLVAGLALLTSGLVHLPGLLAFAWVLSGVGLTAWGMWQAERRLGTPLLLSPRQGRLLARLLQEGWTLVRLRGGGGAHLWGQGPLWLWARDPHGRTRAWRVDPQGRMTPLDAREAGHGFPQEGTGPPAGGHPQRGGKDHEEVGEPA